VPGKSGLLVWMSSFELLLCVQEICDKVDTLVAMADTVPLLLLALSMITAPKLCHVERGRGKGRYQCEICVRNGG